MEEIKSEDLEVGQIFTILSHDSEDRSFVGSILEVTFVEVPFVIFKVVAEEDAYWVGYPAREFKYKTDKMTFGIPSEEYIQKIKEMQENKITERARQADHWEWEDEDEED